jgi:hypothetical protein
LEVFGNEMAQSAVERKFEIIGEALNQLAKLDAKRVATLGHCDASALGRVGRRLNQFKNGRLRPDFRYCFSSCLPTFCGGCRPI